MMLISTLERLTEAGLIEAMGSGRALRDAAGEGETYDEDRVTDYLFDQNDYTTSDGSHLKVPTAFDYVYEGDNGAIYYTDSALLEPQGATRLTPN